MTPQRTLRTAAVKLGTVVIPIAVMADYGFRRAASIGGALGFGAALSIAALWLLMAVLMVHFFPEIQGKAVNRIWRYGLWSGFTLALIWAVARACQFYARFSGLACLAGAVTILAIWSTTASYLLALGVWAAAVRQETER